MCNYITINFNRSKTVVNKADFGEKLGSFGLGLLRIGFGKTVKVQQSSNSADELAFASKVHSTGAKVAAVALFVLALPITVLLAGIGFIATLCSKSYKHISDVYSKYRPTQAELADKNLGDLPSTKIVTHSASEDSTPPNTKAGAAAGSEDIDTSLSGTSNPLSDTSTLTTVQDEQPSRVKGKIKFGKFIREQVKDSSIEDLALVEEQFSLLPEEDFKNICTNTNDMNKRYELYVKMFNIRDTFSKALPLNSGLVRKWKAMELYVRNAETEQLGSVERFLELAEELTNGSYSKDDIRIIFESTYSFFKIHPSLKDFTEHFDKIDLKATYTDLKSGSNIQPLEVKSRRKLKILTGENNEKIAKIIGNIDKKDIAAYGLTQLMGTNIVPMTVASKDGKTLQKYLTKNVLLFYDFLDSKPDASKILSSISDSYIHFYLLQAILLGQADGHLKNTFIKFDDDNQFEELIDFDNEEILERSYYETAGSCEGKGTARITLMGLDQAKENISRALLLLITSPEVRKQLMNFFREKPGFKATKERLDKIHTICKFALENSVSITFEDIYFSLFTHEDAILRQRELGVNDLVGFSCTKGYSDQFARDNKSANPKASETFFSNLKSFQKPSYTPFRENGDREQYGGKFAIEEIRRQWQLLPSKEQETITLYETLHPDEIDIEKYKDTCNPLLTSLCLKGAPGIAARRISREFPNASLRVVQNGERHSLVIGMPEAMKDALKWLGQKKKRLEIDKAFYWFFKRTFQREVSYIKKMNRYFNLPLSNMVGAPECAAKWILLWVTNKFEECCFKTYEDGNKYFLEIDRTVECFVPS